MAAVTTRITFKGGGGDELAARLDSPASPPIAYAIFAHCFTCSKDILAASRIADALVGRGIGVLRFDFTGLGASEGEFANTNFSSNVADLIKAADHLRRTHRAPQLLIGHSLGGAAVLAAAGDIPEVRAIATIGAPADAAHVLKSFGAARDTIEREGEAAVTLAGRPFTIRRSFLDDVRHNILAERIANLRRALLVLHAPRDAVVGIENASAIFEAAKHPKSFISLDDADHLLTRRADAEYAGSVIAGWAARYLDPPPVEQAAPPPGAGTVRVAESGEGPFGQRISVGRHVWTADEPVSLGGEDAGPSPYDMLAAALGACTAMTLRLYARHKGIALGRVTVDVAHGKVYAQDCAECEGREGRVDRFERTIRIDGDLSAELEAKVVEIAGKCPVHRTLESRSVVVTTLQRG